EQPEAGDRGRQHERELDERDEQGAAAEPRRREQIRRRRAEQEDQDLRCDRRLRRDDERVGDGAIRELPDERRGGDLREDRDRGQHEERQREKRRREDDDGDERAAHHFLGRKPAASSLRCPALLSSLRTKVRAAARCLLDLTTATAYR